MRKKEPKVSVVMALYNVEEYLEKSVNSILNQTYKNIEIIMCDDCSKDGTLKLAKKLAKQDSRIKVLENKENLKSGKTRNRCIEDATGKYIAIQDADDYSDLTRIEKQVNFLEENKEYDFVSSGIYRFDENGIWGEYHSWSEKPINKDFLWGLPFVHAATMFTKESLNKINNYQISKDTIRTEDFDLFLRLYIEGFKGYNLKECLYFVNENIDSYMRRKYRYRIDEAKMRFNAYKKLGLMPKGIIFAIKPLIVGLIPRKLQYKLKKNKSNFDNDPKRILEVISRPHLGGIETMIMNVYRQIDYDKVQFDFTNHSSEKGNYEDEIISLGGKIHYIKPIREIGVLKYILQIKKLIKDNNYKIVHSHISINNSFVLLGAFLGGAKIRISHAHTTSTEKPDTFKYNFVISIMKKINKIFANKYCACGTEAAKFLYGKKAVEKGKVTIINNAIDIDKFKKCFNKKKEYRKKYNLPQDKIIIGHVGRFVGNVKNHQFILNIALEMKKQKLDNYYFVLVGDGEEIDKYKNFVNENKLNDMVLFYGTSLAIQELFATFDYFILPSLYEGFPVTIVESQAVGINTIISNTITKEVDLGIGLVRFLEINIDDIEDWIKEFIKKSKKIEKYDIIENALKEKGFDINMNVKAFYKLYEIDK